MSGGVAGGVLPEKLGGGLWPTSFPGSFPCQGKDPGNEVGFVTQLPKLLLYL